MPHTLQNEHLSIQMDLPEEGYQSARFDWTGKIKQVTFRGMPITGRELTDPGQPDQGWGLFNEFGMEQPIGFDEMEEGEWFHKIGVGLLQKEATVYDFKKAYSIRPAQFEIHPEKEKITLICRSELHGGYAYLLKKMIRLRSNGFILSYELTNTGDKSIRTHEYVHNFMAIAEDAINKRYRLTLPFSIRPELFGETVNPEYLVDIGEHQINFHGQPREPFFFSNLSGGESVSAQWTLENVQRQISISETGSFPCSAINLWGHGQVISPELFHEINLARGKTTRWSRAYGIRFID